MSASHRAHSAALKSSSLYLGSLDGLRLIAFLLVFGNHLPAPAAMALFGKNGWVGVELFFAISAYLLFRLLDAENLKEGHISVRNFYLRRVLRIYPLLVAYYALTFVVREGFLHPMAWARFGTTLASLDNIGAWWWGYNYTIQGVGHLWTLAFEFQIYMLLPVAFLAWKKWGRRRFLWGLLAVEAVAFSVRLIAVHERAPHVGLEVIPYFRPESILAGLALAVIGPTWKAGWSFVVAICAGVVFISLPDPNRAYVYFPAAVMAAGLVDASVRFGPFRSLLSLRPVRYLGTISFGLYVFHIAAIWTVVRVLESHRLGLTSLINRPVIIILSVALTVAVSAASYRYLERPFLRLKRRFTAIEGREVEASEDDAPHQELSRTD